MATPKYLLEQALARFPILLIKDEQRLERYLRDSLEFYALHSGVLVRVRMDQPELLITPPPLGFNGIYNKRGEWCMSRYDKVTNFLHVQDDPKYSPWDLSYFTNLRHWDIETDLPSDLEFTLVIDHIESIVGEANSQQMELSKFVAGLESMNQKTAGEYAQARERIETQIRTQAHLADFALL
jgi:hypothetical protein